ncbi:hypothetical protein SODALDRAFT_139905 [Sodiomyces alkalinus F11]|uniref:Uncharacterized protein n=1 Tax=Sodiomyces alkalinus (strain CBS 110278 / VKM F-3762 / F11) TaxID=1314773 RepID=A0A3N2PZK7_SODAK|nr:hypothetical protein SODALDRAFT_139905 [Sodiomyces alkalinus F11]ROT39866.1 hypothetical protein SODALDRAFT_139905 [Sodiomyces alkalinus F11]
MYEASMSLLDDVLTTQTHRTFNDLWAVITQSRRVLTTSAETVCCKMGAVLGKEGTRQKALNPFQVLLMSTSSEQTLYVPIHGMILGARPTGTLLVVEVVYPYPPADLSEIWGVSAASAERYTSTWCTGDSRMGSALAAPPPFFPKSPHPLQSVVLRRSVPGYPSTTTLPLRAILPRYLTSFIGTREPETRPFRTTFKVLTPYLTC